MQALKIEFVDWLASRRRIINLLIGISAVLAYEILRAYYRPWVYAQGLNDFHVADTLGNSLGTVAQVFVFISVLGRTIQHDYVLIRIVTVAVVVYELAHPLLGKPIDPWDIVATVLAGIFCEALHRLIHRQPQVSAA